MKHDTPDRPEPPEEVQEPDGIETCPDTWCGGVRIIDDTAEVQDYIEESNLDICDCPPDDCECDEGLHDTENEGCPANNPKDGDA